MRASEISFLLVLNAFALCGFVSAQQRSVAITVDDLPFAGSSGQVSDLPVAKLVNQKMLQGFRNHRVPVTAFVIERSVVTLGAAGAGILQSWVEQGFDLGNHTYSHPDVNTLAVSQVEEEVLRGEKSSAPLMEAAGKKVGFFRFPMNHTGETKAKHDELAAFLSQHGYQVASCTIENSDYIFNRAYNRALDKGDEKFARKLRREYIAYTRSEIDYYASLNKQVLGYEPPEVMLLHDNRLNGDVIEDVVKVFAEKGYKFISLREAQSGSGVQDS